MINPSAIEKILNIANELDDKKLYDLSEKLTLAVEELINKKAEKDSKKKSILNYYDAYENISETIYSYCSDLSSGNSSLQEIIREISIIVMNLYEELLKTDLDNEIFLVVKKTVSIALQNTHKSCAHLEAETQDELFPQLGLEKILELTNSLFYDIQENEIQSKQKNI